MPQGVPTFGKFGKKARKSYLKQLEDGQSRYAAAQNIGVSREMVRLYRKATPTFAQEELDAEQAGVDARADRVEDAMQTAAESGNVKAGEFVLTNLRPDKWQKQRAAFVDAEQFEAILREIAAEVVARRAQPVCLPAPGSDDPAHGAGGPPALNGKAHQPPPDAG